MADLLIHNANIRTMDPSRPFADWILIRDGTIAALGSGDPPAAARRIDAGGHLVLPGFQDAHIHLLNGGTDLIETAQLYDCTTLADIQAALRKHAATWNGPMIWGAGWQNGFFGDQNLTRAVLDAAVPDRPCLIYDDSFHNACLNTRALVMAGIADDTPDPPNGHIVRHADGRVTGMLHEDAILRALRHLPGTAPGTWTEGLHAAMRLANSLGITGVLDPQILDHHVTHYARARDAGALTLRVSGAMMVTTKDDAASVLDRLTALRAAHSGEMFHLHSAKFFLDGVLENRTAALIDPYADADGGNAPLMFPQPQIDSLFTALDAARFQIHVHCIGDAAVRATLDGFQAARAANGRWPGLHQIAHCQLIHPADRHRFRDLGVMANFQPLWAANDHVIPDVTMAMIGAERGPWTYATRSLIDAGAPFCIGSDWAVTTLNPFQIIGTAITREPPRARGRAAPFFPGERMTIEEAIAGYTTHAAAACWRGHMTGRLSPGFSADLIVLDRDILAGDPYAVAETRVLATLFKGVPVHDTGLFGAPA